MHTDSGERETSTPSKSQNFRFIPFLLILLCAVAIGFGIKYYKGRLGVTTEVAWEAYFSEVNAVGSPYSLENRLCCETWYCDCAS